MQVHLHVHEAPGHDVVFDRVDAFFLDHDAAVVHAQGFDDAVDADGAFEHAGVEAVALDVIEAVGIELGGDELMQEGLGVLIGENLNGGFEPAIELSVELLHEGEGHHLMVEIGHEGVLEGVRKRAVTNIVQKDGGKYALNFLIVDGGVFVAQGREHFEHEPDRAEGVGKTRVLGARKYGVGKPQLTDASEPLHIRVIEQPQGLPLGHVHKAVDGIGKDFVELVFFIF